MPGTTSSDLDEHGAIKSRDQRIAERALYNVHAVGETTHLVPANTRPSRMERNYLVPSHDGWEGWVVDAYLGLPIEEIAGKHAVPMRDLLEFMQSPGVVRDTIQMLDRQRHHEAKTRALRLSIDLLDSHESRVALEAVARITKLLEVRLEQDRAEDVMSPEERDQQYRKLVLGQE